MGRVGSEALTLVTAPPPVPESTTFDCQSCGATLTLREHERTAVCPFCASPAVVEKPSSENPDPTFVVGFVLDQPRASQRVRQWIKRRGWFAHGGLASAVVQETRGVYLPAYLYGAVADSDYEAEIGENYTTTETYTTTDSKGNTVVRTRVVVKTEWRHLAGRHSCYLVDVVVTASRGLSNAELEAVEPFDLGAIRRYDPALFSGWIAEEPSIVFEKCRELAHSEGTESVGRKLARFMPGDSHRGLRFETRVHDEILHLVSLPIWIFALRYDPNKPPIRVTVNGQTGKVGGAIPLSPIKITIAVILGLLLVLAIVLIVRGGI